MDFRARFITLTDMRKGQLLYIDYNNIQSILDRENGSCIIVYGSSLGYDVKETPNEIFKLIEIQEKAMAKRCGYYDGWDEIGEEDLSN